MGLGGESELHSHRPLPPYLAPSVPSTSVQSLLLSIMPFAFWKKFRSETRSSVLSDAAVAKELRAIIPPTPGKMEVTFEDHDSGVFLFDEDAEEFSVPSLIDHALAAADSTPLVLQAGASKIPKIMTSLGLDSDVCVVVSLLDGSNALLHTQTTPIACGQPLHTESATTFHLPEETKPNLLPAKHSPTKPSMDTTWTPQPPLITAYTQPKIDDNESVVQHPTSDLSTPQSLVSAGIPIAEFQTRDRSQSRDSGICMCDTIVSKSLSQAP
jgi:hypothetical protein